MNVRIFSALNFELVEISYRFPVIFILIFDAGNPVLVHFPLSTMNEMFNFPLISIRIKEIGRGDLGTY